MEVSSNGRPERSSVPFHNSWRWRFLSSRYGIPGRSPYTFDATSGPGKRDTSSRTYLHQLFFFSFCNHGGNFKESGQAGGAVGGRRRWSLVCAWMVYPVVILLFNSSIFFPRRLEPFPHTHFSFLGIGSGASRFLSMQNGIEWFCHICSCTRAGYEVEGGFKLSLCVSIQAWRSAVCVIPRFSHFFLFSFTMRTENRSSPRK